MKLRKVKSITEALKILARSEYLYDYYGNAVDIMYWQIGDLHKLYCESVRRMMTVEEARRWSNSPIIQGRWVVRRINESVWNYPEYYNYSVPMGYYLRAELIEGEVFKPIDFSIEDEE